MEKKKHISDDAWEAIAKQLYGQEKVGGDNPATGSWDADQFAEISETAAQIDQYFNLKKFDAKAAYQQVRPRLETSRRMRQISWFNQPAMKVAALVVFALLLASVGFYMGNHSWENLRTAGVIVDDYGISRIELADGSVVTLNRDSKINYPEKFSASAREVEIEGEAFFEVQPDPARPFVIHAGEATIKVLGTSFNVSAYPQNNEIEVVVTSGKVQVSKTKAATNQQNDLILDPGDKGVFATESNELRKIRNDNPNYLAWKTRDLIFDKTSLKEVLEQLNKVYRAQVRTADPELDQLLLTAHFENRPLDFILEVIALTHHLEVTNENGQYVLKK